MTDAIELVTECSHNILNSLNEDFKSSNYVIETLLDPVFGYAYISNKAALNKAHNIKEHL